MEDLRVKITFYCEFNVLLLIPITIEDPTDLIQFVSDFQNYNDIKHDVVGNLLKKVFNKDVSLNQHDITESFLTPVPL